MNTLEILTAGYPGSMRDQSHVVAWKRARLRFDLIKAALTSVAASEINPLDGAEYAIRCADSVLALLEQETSETLPAEDVLAQPEKEGK